MLLLGIGTLGGVSIKWLMGKSDSGVTIGNPVAGMASGTETE
jgi:hypothetical protein